MTGDEVEVVGHDKEIGNVGVDTVVYESEEAKERREKKRERKRKRLEDKKRVTHDSDSGADSENCTIFESLLVKSESDFKKMFSFQQRRNDTTDTYYLIIDNPEITMKQPMIDCNIVEIVNQVLNNKDMIGPRSNAFFAIVTGMGRGKTRTLVEMDRELNSRAGVLSVAITYNHRWERRIVDESLPTSLKYLEYPLSVVTRILSVHYRLQHSKLVRNVKDYLLTTAVNQSANVDTPLFLIRECIRYIIRQQRENHIVVEKFVLLMDESARIEEDLKIENVHNILRQALLDEPLFNETSEDHVEVELVMSCLEVKSTGITSSSSRRIHTITTPEVLTPESVLDHWWMVNVTVTLTRESIFKLLKLISTMNGLPRALQFGASKFEELANKYLASCLSSSSASPWNISAATITELYETIREQVAGHYPAMMVWDLSPELTKALLFCEMISVNEIVMKTVSQGIFTNTLKNLAAEGETKVNPTTTMLTMDIMTSTSTVGVPQIIREMIDILLENMKSCDAKIGYPLEVIANGIINARLLSLAKWVPPNENVYFSISQLFLIENPFNIIDRNVTNEQAALSTKEFLTGCHKVCRSDETFCYHSTILHKSYCDKQRKVGRLFLTDANKSVPANKNIVKLTLDKDECADGGWLFRSPSERISALMIDTKSYKDPSLLEGLPAKQSRHFNSFAEMIKTFKSEHGFKVNSGSMTHAIQEKNTIFVYATTRNQTSTITDRMLMLGDSDTRRFLGGFMEPFYAVCRAISILTNEKQENQST